MDVAGDGGKVQCFCKEQYRIGNWNVRFMYQSKLKVVKWEMARVNINISGSSELKWMGMGEFNSDDHYIYYCEQESLRRNRAALKVNKSPKCSMCLCVLVAQSCLTLCNPMDYILPGSTIHGILQARILEWVAMPSSRGSS